MSDIRTRVITALEGARFEDEAQREKVFAQVEPAFRAIQSDARESAIREAAVVAKVGWLHCEYGELADADCMCALSEHTEAAILALI